MNVGLQTRHIPEYHSAETWNLYFMLYLMSQILVIRSLQESLIMSEKSQKLGNLLTTVN